MVGRRLAKMKNAFTLLLPVSFMLLYLGHVGASTLQTELSDPVITLSVDKQEVFPGEELIFTVEFANRGRAPAEDVTITFNVPLDARSPLSFVSSEPQTDRWLSTEYGNLPEFFLPLIETDAATQSGKIHLDARVRESVPSQEFTASAGLLAPKRELGKKQISSNFVTIRILSEASETASAAGARTPRDPMTSAFASPSAAQTEETQQPSRTFLGRVLSSDTLWSTLLFLGATALIVVAFLAGRKSRAS